VVGICNAAKDNLWLCSEISAGQTKGLPRIFPTSFLPKKVYEKCMEEFKKMVCSINELQAFLNKEPNKKEPPELRTVGITEVNLNDVLFGQQETPAK